MIDDPDVEVSILIPHVGQACMSLTCHSGFFLAEALGIIMVELVVCFEEKDDATSTRIVTNHSTLRSTNRFFSSSVLCVHRA